MESTITTIARNKERLEALIHGYIDSTTVAGVSITRLSGDEVVDEGYVLRSSGLCVVADEIELSATFADFNKNGMPVAFIVLREE